jgi:hypothetical protein
LSDFERAAVGNLALLFRANYGQFEQLLERCKVAVSVQEGMPVQDAKTGDQAIDGLANRQAFLPNRPEILRRGHR